MTQQTGILMPFSHSQHPSSARVPHMRVIRFDPSIGKMFNIF